YIPDFESAIHVTRVPVTLNGGGQRAPGIGREPVLFHMKQDKFQAFRAVVDVFYFYMARKGMSSCVELYFDLIIRFVLPVFGPGFAGGCTVFITGSLHKFTKNFVVDEIFVLCMGEWKDDQ